jgi:hypothetical protein
LESQQEQKKKERKKNKDKQMNKDKTRNFYEFYKKIRIPLAQSYKQLHNDNEICIYIKFEHN